MAACGLYFSSDPERLDTREGAEWRLEQEGEGVGEGRKYFFLCFLAVIPFYAA